MKTLILLFYMITAAIYDIKTKRLPLWLLLFFSVISIVYVFFSTKDSFNIFSFIPGIFMLIISFISNYSLGLGDSIFILSLGLLLSISDLICQLLIQLLSKNAKLLIMEHSKHACTHTQQSYNKPPCTLHSAAPVNSYLC